MPLNKEALALETSPRSVKDARRWVVQICRELGRDDLADSAALGVSELVTNALLHAVPPLAVRVRGTRHHPRVEVFDGSQVPPAPSAQVPGEHELLSTIGRGLGIVAMLSNAWGADINDGGKAVWFEPSPEPSEGLPALGDLYDPSRAVPQTRYSLEDGITVHFPALPIRLYVDFRNHHAELRRELRLLSLAHESDYPVAKSLSDLFLRFEEELRASKGSDDLEAAIGLNERLADITFVVPDSTPDTMEQMIELLELADGFCRAERLLSLAATRQQLQFQRWYLGEFVHQARGEAPQAWTGSTRVERPQNRS